MLHRNSPRLKIIAFVVAMLFASDAIIMPTYSGDIKSAKLAPASRFAERGSRETAPAFAMRRARLEARAEEEFERLGAEAREEFFFRYGRLPEDHPVARYVKEAFDEVLGEGAKDYQVAVLPGWNEINAIALPDGTVLVSAKLLEFLMYKEELQGGLAHEIVHIKRRHAKIRDEVLSEKDKGAIEGLVDIWLKVVGIERLQEYESDLRGVIEILERNGINSLGMKVFFERLDIHTKEMNFGRAPKDLAHGGLEDRALNIESLFYFFDLASLSHRLKKVPENLNDEIEKASAEFKWPWSWENPAKLADEELQALDRMRRKAVDEMAASQLEVARGRVSWLIVRYEECERNLSREKAGLPDKMEDLGLKSDELSGEIDEIEEELEGDISERRRDSLEKRHKRLKGQRKRLREEIALLNQGQESLDEEIAKATQMKRMLLELRGRLDERMSRELPADSDNIETAERTEEKDGSERGEASKAATDIGNRIIGKMMIGAEFNSAHFNEILNQIEEAIGGKDLGYAISLFWGISMVIGDRIAEKVDEEQTNTENEASEALRMEVGRRSMGRYTLFRLFEIGLGRFRQFSCLTIGEREALLFEAFLQLVYGLELRSDFAQVSLKQGPDGRMVLIEKGEVFTYRLYNEEDGTSSDEQNALYPSDRDYLDDRLNSIEDWFEPRRSHQEIIVLYNSLVKGAFGPALTETRLESSISEEIFVKVLAKYLGDFNSNFFNEVKALEDAGVPVKEIIRGNKGSFGLALSKLWHAMPQSPNHQQAKQILEAASFVEDPFLRLALKSYAYRVIWPMLDFEERLDLLFAEDAEGAFDITRLNHLVEEEAETKEELCEIRKRLEGGFDAFMKRGSVEAGIATFISNMHFDPEFAREFIIALLKTSQDDSRLKSTVYAAVSDTYEELLGDEGDEEEIVSRKTKLATAERMVRLIFNMDEVGKHLLLRKVLTGEQGLLSSQAHRAGFLGDLLKEMIENGRDGGLMRVMEEVVQGLGKVFEWRPVYFSLQPLLSNRIATSPEEPTPWREIVAIEEEDGETRRHIEHVDRKPPEKTPWRYEAQWLHYSEQELRRVLVGRRALLPRQERSGLSPLSFIVEFTQHIGALGVRFLQLLPQFAELPEEYQAEFSKVYDAVAGMSKLVAVATLEREWPEFWDEISRVGKRVGGGSLMSVYRVKTTDGRDEVIKVLNPNLLYFVKHHGEFIDEVLDKLIETHGDKYRVAKLVVEEVRRWIERDVNFEGFLEKDRRFRELNDGFHPEGFQHSIYIPRTKGPASKYFIREEFVEGKNLTQWEALVGEGHNMKEIVSLIVKNYIGQLTNGMAHSDVHIGNFRVTADGRVAILDRNFYLELTPEMQELVNALLVPGMVSPDELVDKLISLSEIPVPEDKREALKASLARSLNDIAAGNWKGISKFLVELRQNNVTLPLEVTLIFKNLNSLQAMSKKAGFSSLVEAYLYSRPEGGDVWHPSPDVIAKPGVRDGA